MFYISPLETRPEKGGDLQLVHISQHRAPESTRHRRNRARRCTNRGPRRSNQRRCRWNRLDSRLPHAPHCRTRARLRLEVEPYPSATNGICDRTSSRTIPRGRTRAAAVATCSLYPTRPTRRRLKVTMYPSVTNMTCQRSSSCTNQLSCVDPDL